MRSVALSRQSLVEGWVVRRVGVTGRVYDDDDIRVGVTVRSYDDDLRTHHDEIRVVSGELYDEIDGRPLIPSHFGGIWEIEGSGDLLQTKEKSNRMIRWQILNDNVIEMIDMCFTTHLNGNGIRLLFPYSIVGSCVSFASQHTPSSSARAKTITTCLFILLHNNIMARLVFTLRATEANKTTSMFVDWRSVEVGLFPLTKFPHIPQLCRVDYDTIATINNSGGILITKWKSQTVIESELRQTSFLKRLWSTMTLGYSSLPSSVIALGAVWPSHSSSLLFSVNSDFIIRLWDLTTDRCVWGDSLPTSHNSQLHTQQLTCLLRTHRLSDTSFRLIVGITIGVSPPYFCLLNFNMKETYILTSSIITYSPNILSLKDFHFNEKIITLICNINENHSLSNILAHNLEDLSLHSSSHHNQKGDSISPTSAVFAYEYTTQTLTTLPNHTYSDTLFVHSDHWRQTDIRDAFLSSTLSSLTTTTEVLTKLFLGDGIDMETIRETLHLFSQLHTTHLHNTKQITFQNFAQLCYVVNNAIYHNYSLEDCLTPPNSHSHSHTHNHTHTQPQTTTWLHFCDCLYECWNRLNIPLGFFSFSFSFCVVVLLCCCVVLLYCCVVLCCVVLCCVVLCCVVLCCVVLCCVVLCCVVLCFVVVLCCVLYCIVLYCIVLYCVCISTV
jgi:hypothetical protein